MTGIRAKKLVSDINFENIKTWSSTAGMNWIDYPKTKSIIDILQKNINLKIDQALEQIAENKNIPENLTKISIYRKNAAAINKARAYINPQSYLEDLLSPFLGLLSELGYEQATLIREMLFKQKSSNKISEELLTKIILNGQFASYFDKVNDIIQFSVKFILLNTKKIMRPPSDLSDLDEEISKKNTTELFLAFNKMMSKLIDIGLPLTSSNLEGFNIYIKNFLDVGMEEPPQLENFRQMLLRGEMTPLVNKLYEIFDFQQKFNLLLSTPKPVIDESKEAKSEISPKTKSNPAMMWKQKVEPLTASIPDAVAESRLYDFSPPR